jgi:hypothetical protein
MKFRRKPPYWIHERALSCQTTAEELFPAFKKPQDAPELFFAFPVEPFLLTIMEEKPQPRGSRQNLFGHFIEAGEVFVFPVLQKRRNPEPSVRTIDQENLRRVCAADQNVPPLEVTVRKTMPVQGARSFCDLLRDRCNPLSVVQTDVFFPGQLRQIVCVGKTLSDYGAAFKKQSAFFDPVRDQRGAGNFPLLKPLKVFPFAAQARTADPAPEAFARPAVEFHIIKRSVYRYAGCCS